MEHSADRQQTQRFQLPLRTIHEEAGIRQIDPAASVSVPKSFVSKYESRKRRLWNSRGDTCELGSRHHLAGHDEPVRPPDSVIAKPPDDLYAFRGGGETSAGAVVGRRLDKVSTFC